MAELVRNYKALLAVLVMMALTSFTVHTILADDAAEVSFSPEITGNAVAETSEPEAEGGDGVEDVIEKAAGWVLDG